LPFLSKKGLNQGFTSNDIGVELQQTAYALDATIIGLCLSLFPWAKFRNRKGAVKLHTLMDLRGSIPVFIIITHGKVHEVTVLDDLIIEAGAIYIIWISGVFIEFSRHRHFL
jgi:hypothetical protein